jgi:two-component system, NarL family, response regulator EvgA
MALVLVADDDEAVRMLLRLNLEIEGHSVVAEAADGKQAIEAVVSHRPDVMVLDMMMPGTNGADVLKALTDCSSRPCVVAYSASPTHLQLADELGADQTVLKFGDMSVLFAAVGVC